VRKEAVLKALGTGVSGIPASIETGLDPAASGSLEVASGAGHGTHWWSCPLSLPSGYLGALALEGEARPVLAWQAEAIPP
jgi:phosphopantetheinyl transferase